MRKLIALSILSTLITFLVAEIVYRQISPPKNHGSYPFGFDSQLGWSGKVNYSGNYLGAPFKNNSLGFHDDEPKPNDEKDALFIGDSYTRGYMIKREDRFTDKLAKMIKSHNVRNLGVTGYSTDQSYLSLKQHIGNYNPDIVFLTFCTGNDIGGNMANNGNNVLKPYFQDGKFKGLPVKRTNVNRFKRSMFGHSKILLDIFKMLANNNEFVYFKEDPTGDLLGLLNNFCKEKRLKFAVGLTERDHAVEVYLHENDIPWLILEAPILKEYKHHWSPEGNTEIANQVTDFLRERNWVQ